MDMSKPDMTTSISTKFKAMPEVSNITAFNTDDFSTWRSAFRECCKLSSRVIDGQINEETQQRLDVWCSVGTTASIAGALAGKEWGYSNKQNSEELLKINDYCNDDDNFSFAIQYRSGFLLV